LIPRDKPALPSRRLLTVIKIDADRRIALATCGPGRVDARGKPGIGECMLRS
jgi:hypothetical protein